MTNKELLEKISFETKNIYEIIDDTQKLEVSDFSVGYKKFIDSSKTERESVDTAIENLTKAGFVCLDDVKRLKSGDKVYISNRNKGLIAVVVGKNGFDDGVNIVASHVDVPRIDIKQNPVYESGDMAFLKTHYYGGIKKYQWAATPLAMHGVVILGDGQTIKLSIGENENEPVFCITDLLPHLGAEQMTKKATEVIRGEGLNILIGSIPVKDDDIKEKIKFTILKYLYDTYGIIERDFISAEIEMVPAGNARDVGFDRSMIGAYGHDDRVCAYTSLEALKLTQLGERSTMCLLVDKEETGSQGATGMVSTFFDTTLAKMVKLYHGDCDLCHVNDVLAKSKCLSADVAALFDPEYASMFEVQNAAKINYGVVITKYTGSRGKSETNDANAEFVHEVKELFTKNGVVWQTAELGRVDGGGGGTIAMFLANRNIETIDCGVGLLSMHAPFEIASKADIYMTYKAYKAFFEN